jgi:hypothetical protein
VPAVAPREPEWHRPVSLGPSPGLAIEGGKLVPQPDSPDEGQDAQRPREPEQPEPGVGHAVVAVGVAALAVAGVYAASRALRWLWGSSPAKRTATEPVLQPSADAPAPESPAGVVAMEAFDALGIEVRLRSDEVDLALLYRARPEEVQAAVERAVGEVVGPDLDFVVHLAPGSLVARITLFFRKAWTKLGGRAAEAPGVGPVSVDTGRLGSRVAEEVAKEVGTGGAKPRLSFSTLFQWVRGLNTVLELASKVFGFFKRRAQEASEANDEAVREAWSVFWDFLGGRVPEFLT